MTPSPVAPRAIGQCGFDYVGLEPTTIAGDGRITVSRSIAVLHPGSRDKSPVSVEVTKTRLSCAYGCSSGMKGARRFASIGRRYRRADISTRNVCWLGSAGDQ